MRKSLVIAAIGGVVALLVSAIAVTSNVSSKHFAAAEPAQAESSSAPSGGDGAKSAGGSDAKGGADAKSGGDAKGGADAKSGGDAKGGADAKSGGDAKGGADAKKPAGPPPPSPAEMQPIKLPDRPSGPDKATPSCQPSAVQEKQLHCSCEKGIISLTAHGNQVTLECALVP